MYNIKTVVDLPTLITPKMKEISVSDINVEKLTINVPVKYKNLVPTTLIPEKIDFVLNNCNNAIANAIRRTVLCELNVRALYCEYEDILTDDPHIIPEMIQKRLRMIPLSQDIPQNAVFEVGGRADESTFDIKTSMIKQVGGSKGSKGSKGSEGSSNYFNKTITLLTLQPARSIKIKNIHVVSEVGIKIGRAMHAVGFNATSIALDVDQYNQYENTGVPSHNADPRKWKVSFNTNGTMSPNEIVINACNNIIERLKKVSDIEIIEHENQYILKLYGESHTIANCIVKSTVDLYPDIDAITYHVASVDRVATIKIRYSDDISIMLKTVLDNLIKKFQIIKGFF